MRRHGFGLDASAAAVVVAFLAGCGQQHPPPAPPPAPAAAPPAPKQISIDELPELIVRAGTSGTARLGVNRAGHVGEATVTIASSAADLAVTADPIAAGSREGEIVVTAADSLGTSDLSATVTVTVTLDGMTAQGMLPVKIPLFEPPDLEQDADVIVQPGRTTAATLRIDRKGCPGRPIGLGPAAPAGGGQPPVTEAAPAPAVTCVPIAIPDDADVAVVEFAVDEMVEEGPRTVVLSGSTMGREFPVECRVQVLAEPYRLAGPRAVWIAPGETKRLRFEVGRPAHAGEIAIAVGDLPEGVSAEPVSVPAGGGDVDLVLRASDTAAAGVRSAVLRSSGGPFRVDRPLVVRIRRPDDSGPVAAILPRGDAASARKQGPFSGRATAESRRALADACAGPPEAAAAVTGGLAWLARAQGPDGSWSAAAQGGAASRAAPPPAGTVPQPPPGSAGGTTRSTAAALLAFLAEGAAHQRPRPGAPPPDDFRRRVELGIVALCRNQAGIRGPGDGFLGGDLAAHCLATTAIAEDYALSRDTRLKPHARQAAKFLAATQRDDGGWSADGAAGSDPVTTAWAVQALRAVRAAGLPVPARTLAQAGRFVERCGAGPAGATGSGDAPAPGAAATPLATAAALACRLDLGAAADDPGLREAAARLLATAAPGRGCPPMPYLFMATAVLRATGGEDFDAWNHLVRDRLIRTQCSGGDHAGSWDPDVDGGDRVEATAMSVLTLQSPYRVLQAPARPADAEPAADDAPPSDAASAADEP